MDFKSDIRKIKGIGDKTAKLFENLGVYTLRDMLLNFPREYKIYPQPNSLASFLSENSENSRYTISTR